VRVIDAGSSLITRIMALIHVPFILDDMLMVRGHVANIQMHMLMDVNIARIPGKKEPHLSE
jgi:hypothetical protein